MRRSSSRPVSGGSEWSCRHERDIDQLPNKEVLGRTNPDNKNLRFAGILEPSDGLDPSTPPYHRGFALREGD
jgi:hypothetical protein